MSDATEQLVDIIATAKRWRGLSRMTVLLTTPDGSSAEVQELPVQLGDARRRWKRLAATLEPMMHLVVGVRGYSAKGEIVGTWTAPDDDDGQDDDVPAESDAMAQHRQHTQWVIREVSKIYEGSLRLTAEMAASVIELVKRSGGPTQPQVTEDDATKTLGMLLTAAMANQNRSDDDEAQRDARRPRSDAAVQGQSTEPGQAGA